MPDVPVLPLDAVHLSILWTGRRVVLLDATIRLRYLLPPILHDASDRCSYSRELNMYSGQGE